ncbi:MAG: hypothetical protein ACE15C_02225 [Phycisphaerae bacterium]
MRLASLGAMSSVAMVLTWAVLTTPVLAQDSRNIVENPSFEDNNPGGKTVFPGWSFTAHEGQCDLRASAIARTGKASAMLCGANAPKMRLMQTHDLEPGRYRITAFLRGLDIGKGTWGWTTEFMFDGSDKGGYFQLDKNGTFGWTKLTFVGEIKEKHKAQGPSFGLCAPGWLWVDDVTMEKVGDDVALTPKPVLDKEEAPIAPPGKIDSTAVRCPECSYRNMPAWKNCYACGTSLEVKKAVVTGPPVKLITSFEEAKCPFEVGDEKAQATVVEEHATDGKKALKLSRSYASMSAKQDWAGYDYLKADMYTDATDPMEITVEVRDIGTTDYYTRVNYTTIVPPGASTLIIPIKQLYVGEKSRPGRMLDAGNVTRLVYAISDKPQAPLFIDNIRVERDEDAAKVFFDGLLAYDFQPNNTCPLMEGFTPVVPSTIYSEGKGYGLKNAGNPAGQNALQPDPLYQDYINITQGGMAVDVPNGKYHVWVNVNRPNLYWGEVQQWTKRTIKANGKVVVDETRTADDLKKQHFRFWNTDDLPTDNTFDKYQKVYDEKAFDVDVTDGQLFIEFGGQGYEPCAVSALVIYPASKAAEGEKFLKYVESRRRFHFDNYFKRTLHKATGDALAPNDNDKKLGLVIFAPNFMKDVYYNDTPLKSELGQPAKADAFAGEMAPLTVAVVPLMDLGRVTATVSDLSGDAGTIPASAIEVGYVSYRINRVTMEGSVYTIGPRFVMPTSAVEMPKDITRQFVATVKVPADAKPGLYTGKISFKTEKGGDQGAAAVKNSILVELRVRSGALDDVDIPAGPWGIEAPYIGDLVCMKKLREYGFTDFSSGPKVRYSGFKDGKPQLDFTAADKLMATAKELGFRGVVFYSTLVYGYNAYFKDDAAMKAAGFKDYAEFIKALYTPIQKHAEEAGWIPYFINLGDEPAGDDVNRAADNCEAYRKAFPKGPPWFSFATSYSGTDTKSPHARLCKAVEIPNLNGHDEAAIKILHDAGCQWAFYNGGSRWTFGDYMYKAAKQFDMKFRIAWHWNCTAGDPFYALDCREDDYAWAQSTPDGKLMTCLDLFERKREGLGDYRRLLTLARLAKEKAGTPAAVAGEKLIDARMASFKLGQRDHDALFGLADWDAFRAKVNDAIEALRK